MAIPTSTASAIAALLLLAYSAWPAHGHMMQQYPPSRRFSHSMWGGKSTSDPAYENAPFTCNSGGVQNVKDRADEKVDSEILEEIGGSSMYFPLYGEFAENGNMLESEETSKRHNPCGDPRPTEDQNDITYSTPNSEWEIVSTFISGQVIEMDIVIIFYHWGHFEWSICDAADLDDPDGVVTQECFNMYPLTRAPDDGDASPIDPDYTGRYYVDPPCHLNETDQNFNKEGLLSSDSYPPYSVKMRYLLPDIECSHCVLRSYYFTGHRCKHIGYDEFNPPSWPSTCAPEKDDWVLTDIGMCGSTAAWYPEEFWNCADIAITSGGTQTGDDDEGEEITSGGTQTGDDDEGEEMTSGYTQTEYDDEGEEMTSAYTQTEDEEDDDEPSDESSEAGNTQAEDDDEDEEDDDDDEPSPFIDHGCFADTKTERIMKWMRLSEKLKNRMTGERCMNFCTKRGYKYSGTQYGFQCFCGGEDTDHFQHGESMDCRYPCSGDENEMCGGAWCMSVREML